MGLLDALNIGGNALLTHQAAIQITGNNLANVATPGYARQEAVLSPYGTSEFGPGLSAGGGVRLLEVRRLIDNALQGRLNDATSQMHQFNVADSVLRQIESLMNEMTSTDLSSGLVELFNSFSALAADPSSMAARDIVIGRADSVVDRFDFIAKGVDDIRRTLTEQLEGSVRDADRIATQIADLNVQIVTAESGGGSAASLRDQRDQAISELSTLIAVNVREDETGSVNVFIGSEMLVSRGVSRGLALIPHASNPDVAPVLKVSFTDNEGLVQLSGGQIAGLQETRDGEVAEVAERVDALAAQVIWQVNQIHASGRGLEGFSEVTGTYLVDDADAVLNSDDAGLPFTPTNGSFDVVVTTTGSDGSTTSTTTQINVPLTGGAGDMTLNDLVTALNGVGDITASVAPSGVIKIVSTNPNAKISFADDSSGVLAALGVNTFFTGYSAATIGVNGTVASDRQHIAAGLTANAGDGDNAARMAELATANASIAELSGRSLLQYQQELVTDVAVWTSGARESAESNLIVFESLTAQRESLSGVSIDEEAVNLMQYQRAFQGAARYVSVVNELLDIMMGML